MLLIFLTLVNRRLSEFISVLLFTHILSDFHDARTKQRSCCRHCVHCVEYMLTVFMICVHCVGYIFTVLFVCTVQTTCSHYSLFGVHCAYYILTILIIYVHCVDYLFKVFIIYVYCAHYMLTVFIICVHCAEYMFTVLFVCTMTTTCS